MRVAVLLVAVLCARAGGELRVTSLLSDNAVLQTNLEGGIRPFVRGTASPGEVITLSGAPSRTPNKTLFTATADGDGAWVMQLDPHNRWEAFNLTVTGSNSTTTVTANNVHFGNVFVCGGQSNMLFPVSKADNASEILARANQTNLWLFRVPEGRAATAQPFFNCSSGDGAGADPACQWLPVTPATVASFSAVCYLHALEVMRLHTGDTPMGLIQAAVGGTQIEEWASPRALAKCPSANDGPAASQLHNGMVAPLLPFSVRSFLWYQGESNTHGTTRADYGCLFGALINDWRWKWGQGSLPFQFVQLAPLQEGGNVSTIRLAQSDNLPCPGGNVTTTGMATTYDLGGPCPGGQPGTWCTHPTNKLDVAHRLALATLHVAYSFQGPELSDTLGTVNWTGPVLERVAHVSSSEVELHFRHDEGLFLHGTQHCTTCCTSGSPFQGVFSNGTGVPLPPTLDAAAGTVRLAVPPGVGQLSYALSDGPQCALYNSQPLPALPFLVDATPSKPSAANAVRPTAVPLPNRRHQSRRANGLQKPPLGLNTWNLGHINVDEVTLREIGDALVSTGLREAGYNVVVIDDGWEVGRLANGSLVEDPVKFPSGLRALNDYLGDQGIGFGVYTARADRTCSGRPGSKGHEAIDAQRFAVDYGVSYIKIDQCGAGYHPGVDNTSWIRFREGFEKFGRGDITMSVESCPPGDACKDWIADIADLWRTGADVEASWDSIMYNLDTTNEMATVSTKGHYNDPDMLQVGQVGLTLDEQKTQMSMWALINAPLLISTDVRTLLGRTEFLDILLAPEILAVNQDARQVQGSRRSPANATGTEVWARPMNGGSVTVALLNRSPHEATISARFALVGLPHGTSEALARDLWARKNLGIVRGIISMTVPSHATAMVSLSTQFSVSDVP